MLALRINRINGDWDAYRKTSPGNSPPPMTTAQTNQYAAPPD
jgi:hypothetical protein